MLGLDQAKHSSVKSTAFKLAYSTSAGSIKGGTVLLLSSAVAGSASTVAGSSSVATSSSDTVSTTGAVEILLSSPSVATGSGGTGGGTGGMISGGTIEGLEQIELIVRPNENLKQDAHHQYPRGQYEANVQRLEW